MGKNQHVVPNNGKWQVKGEGNTRASGTFDTQKEAIDNARDKAKNEHSELLIHNTNGQIRERNSYGNDPHPPKG
ncbi:DUF2188 domain-containing protein [Candidatus Micrarchaeota archaeon]|nr:DUF2188 domain-containing protein [Candidatus Micrarchaeota archaeon]